MTDSRPNLKKVVINDIDVSSYVLEFEIVQEYKKYIGTAKIILKQSVTNVLDILVDDSPGWSVVVQRGVASATESYSFRGEVISTVIDGTKFVLECNDRYYEAVRANVTTSYDYNIDESAGVGSEIYKDLINNYTELTADDDSVIDTGSNIIIHKFICKNTDVYERVDKIAEFYNYQHYYDNEDNKVRFEPLGYIDSGITLTVGEEIVQAPEWKVDKSKIVNKVTVKGAEQQVGFTQFQDGDNTTGQTVNLSYTPISVKVYVGSGSYDPTGTGTKPSDNEGNLKIGGKRGNTSGSYDYIYDDDVRNRKVFFKDSTDEPSYTPPSGTKNIEVQITYGLPIQVKGSREESITKYGLTERTIELSDIKDFDDAYSYMLAYLDFYSLPFISTTLKVSNTDDINVGRIYRIVDNKNNIDKELIVTKIVKRWPNAFDEVTVGNEIMRELDFNLNVVDRLKRLEEITAQSDDLLVEAIDLTNDMRLEPRYLQQQINNVAGESGIYGHPTFGLYGTAKYGDGIVGSAFVLGHETFGVLGTSELGEAGGAPITIMMLPGKNTYKELVYDDDFYDSANSSETTWNTTSQQIEIGPEVFATAAVWYCVTNAIALGTEYTKFLVNLGEVIDTGAGDAVTDYEIYISGDGKKNWQLVTELNSLTDFEHYDDTGVYIKINSPEGIPIYVKNLYDTYGKLITPAIYVRLQE